MMKSRKVLLLLFIVQLIFALSLGITASAEEPTEIEFFTTEASSSVVRDGDTFTVTIALPENAGFAIAMPKLSYNPDVVTFLPADSAVNPAFGDVQLQDRMKEVESVDKDGNPVTNTVPDPGMISITIGNFDDLPLIMKGDKAPCTATGTVAVLKFKVAPTDQAKELPTEDVELSFTLEASNYVIMADGTVRKDIAPSTEIVNFVSAQHLHTLVIQPAVAPTCTETGLTEGTFCSFCHEVLTAQTVVPALGHDYDKWVSTGNNTHEKICKNDATHVVTETCEGGQATCTDKAICTVCNGEYGELAAHTVGTPATCVSLAVCKVCNAEYGEKGEHVPGAAATCVSPQLCANCNEAVFGDELGAHVPGAAATCVSPQRCALCNEAAFGDELGDHVLGISATCTTPNICALCNAEYGETIPHTPGPAATCTAPQTCVVCNTVLATKEHTPVEIPAVEPTYSSEGATAGEKCSVCDTVLKAPEVVEAKSAAWIWITVIACVVIAGAAVAVVIVKKKRK